MKKNYDKILRLFKNKWAKKQQQMPNPEQIFKKVNKVIEDSKSNIKNSQQMQNTMKQSKEYFKSATQTMKDKIQGIKTNNKYSQFSTKSGKNWVQNIASRVLNGINNTRDRIKTKIKPKMSISYLKIGVILCSAMLAYGIGVQTPRQVRLYLSHRGESSRKRKRNREEDNYQQE